MSSARFRDKNRMAVDALTEAGTYNETLRNIVDQMDILGPRAKAKDSHFTFQTLEGEQRTPEEIVRRLQPQELNINHNGDGDVLVNVGDFVNNARPAAMKRGETEVDIKDMIRPNKTMPGWSPQTMGGISNTDKIHRARFLPETVPADATGNVARARNIGMAEASGDLQQIYDANTMYDFSYADAEQVGDKLLIGNSTLNNFLAQKGLPNERLELVVDPASGKRVKELSSAEQKAYFRNRGVEGTRRWMNMGGRSVGDGNSEVHVPGFHAQMEHQNPFSGSIDALGTGKSDYYSDTEYNKAGSLERYENAEKNDIDTQDYHRSRRAQMIALDSGLGRLELSKFGTGREGTEDMITSRFPAVSYSDERLKKDRTGSVNLDNAMKALSLMRETNKLYG